MKNQMTALALLAAVTLTGCQAMMTHTVIPNSQGKVAVGEVTGVWSDTDKKRFYDNSLKEDARDFPSYDDFMQNHPWVTVTLHVNWHHISRDVTYVRAPQGMGVEKGDLVELRTGNGPKRGYSYNDFGTVLRVLCKAQDTACKNNVQTGFQ